jgi:hypothetical protein
MDVVLKTIETKKVVWFKDANQYLVVDDSFYKVLTQFFSGINKSKLLSFCQSEFEISVEESHEIYNSCLNLQNELKTQNKMAPFETTIDLDQNINRLNYYYHLNNKIINVQFCSEELADLIHSKFEHLTCTFEDEIHVDHVIVVEEFEKSISLVVDDVVVGDWQEDELHYLHGKFSMALLNCSYNKKEDDWLGVLHASAVSYNNESVVFLGDSGSGKSTATTLLSLNGFKVLADDFVPVDAQTGEVVSFPAAISVKESMLQKIEFDFPQLKDSILRVKDSVTNYKYLYPNHNMSFTTSKKCKALVFVEYNADAEDKIVKISKLEALENLIPDSWISQKKENAEAFLEWVVKVPCYSMRYSDNTKMISFVHKLMKDEL